jgi:hypothetical protein
MVITPAVRGLLGIETTNAGRALRFAPQFPADWNKIAVRNVRLGNARYSLTYERTAGRIRVVVKRHTADKAADAKSASDASGAHTISIAPALPTDARVRAVTLRGRPATFTNTRAGDVQRPELSFVADMRDTEIVFDYDEGTDVYIEPRAPSRGEMSEGLRILRARADAGTLRLLLEGRGGRAYTLGVRTPHKLGSAPGVVIKEGGGRGGDAQLIVRFNATGQKYVRREISIPLNLPD